MVDQLTETKFLVDTGASCSIFPHKSKRPPSGPRLRGPGGWGGEGDCGVLRRQAVHMKLLSGSSTVPYLGGGLSAGQLSHRGCSCWPPDSLEVSTSDPGGRGDSGRRRHLCGRVCRPAGLQGPVCGVPAGPELLWRISLFYTRCATPAGDHGAAHHQILAGWMPPS